METGQVTVKMEFALKTNRGNHNEYFTGINCF